MLDNYSDDEIEAVLAHELGHHVHRHILKSIFVQAGITLLGFWLANEVLRYAVERRNMFETMSDFANLPLLILVSTVLSFLLMPALNAYSRFNERQADRYCFESVASVEPFISSMNKLAEQNLAEKTPSRWVEWLLHSHPAITKRVAAADSLGESRTENCALGWSGVVSRACVAGISGHSLSRGASQPKNLFHPPHVFFRIDADGVEGVSAT